MDDAGAADKPQARLGLHAFEERIPARLLAGHKAGGLDGEIADQIRGSVVGDRLGGGLARQRDGVDRGVDETRGVHGRQRQGLALPGPFLGNLLGQGAGRQHDQGRPGGTQIAAVQAYGKARVRRNDLHDLVEPPGFVAGLTESSRQGFLPIRNGQGYAAFV